MTINARIDYSEFDHVLSNEIRKVYQDLLSQNPYSIIKKNTIVRELGSLGKSRIGKKLDKLPITKCLLAEYGEDTEKFALRCLSKAIQSLVKRNKDVSLDNLKKHFRTYQTLSVRVERIISEIIEKKSCFPSNQ